MGIESQSLEPIKTAKLVHEEIKSKYPSSQEFMMAIIEAADKHYAYDGKANLNSVLVRLASIRLSMYGKEGEMLVESDQGQIDLERAKKIYSDVLNFGLLVAAMYHGEATFVGLNGELLDKPARAAV